MPNQSEIEEAIILLKKEGYKVEKEIPKNNVLQLQRDQYDNCVYRLILRNELNGNQAYDILAAIENVLNENNDANKFNTTIEELLKKDLERSQNLEKEYRDKIHQVYIDHIDKLNNYKIS